jgi:hypothetical protein
MLETPELLQVSGPAREGDEPLPEAVANPGVTCVSAEPQSNNSGFQDPVLQAVVALQRSMENEFKARLGKELLAAREKLITRLAALETEIQRASTLLDSVTAEIAVLMDDPNGELARVMRKRAEEGVLRSYLDGLKFAAAASR